MTPRAALPAVLARTQAAISKCPEDKRPKVLVSASAVGAAQRQGKIHSGIAEPTLSCLVTSLPWGSGGSAAGCP